MSDERKNQPSASSFARYEKCPGAFQLIQQAREIGQLAFQDSKDAERGQKIHSWLEDETSIKLSEEEIFVATQLRERAQEQARLIFGDEPYLILKEKRVWLRN